MSQLSELRERVEGASGEDRDLDGFIEAFFATGEYGEVLPAKGGMVVYRSPGPHSPGQGRFEVAEHYTGSIDAALALVERMLPGAEYEITTLYGVAHVTLPLNFTDDLSQSGRRDDGNVPLAILSALLRALEREVTHGG